MTDARDRAILEGETSPTIKLHPTMSEEQLKAFLEAVKAETGLQDQLKAASDADDVVAIAKACGFVISAEALQKGQAEISEEELEGVAGGGCQAGSWKTDGYFGCKSE